MRACLIAALAVVGWLVAGTDARAALATMTVSDVPLRSDRALAAVSSPHGFDYVGLHWRGPGNVWFRVRTQRGAWGAWQQAEQSDGPDPATAEGRRANGWVQGEGVWVGHNRALQVRTTGRVARVRAFTIRSLVSRVPLRRLAAAGEPAIVSRGGWQADETIRKAEPTYSDTLQFAVVHHTAGANDYTAEQAPAVVRAIELYQVKGNGWNDIGYNALVDRYGTVYEGRYGGVDRNVVGAHAKGFNTGSFGIAILGDFGRVTPPRAAVDALEQTIAWRLDLAHADPLRTFTAVSGGNERFAAGTPVVMRGVSGHRDAGSTTCPGKRLYDLLPNVAKEAAAIGLPKLYEPKVEGVFGGPLTFTARLSGVVPWTLRIVADDATGTTVYETTGTGDAVAATWDSSTAPPGRYVWTLEGPGLTPATGSVGAADLAKLQVVGTTVSPEAIAPDGDGTLDTATLSYDLSAGANVGITVADATGAVVATLQRPTWRRAGKHAAAFDGLELPDGLYELRLNASATGGRLATSSARIAISHTLAAVSLASPVFTPNGDGKDDRFQLSYTLSQPAAVKLTILRGAAWAATPFRGRLEAGAQLVDWDGSKPDGRLREGDYVAELAVTDTVTTVRARFSFVADWTAPKVIVRGVMPLRLEVSEPARLLIRTERGTVKVVADRAGVVRIPSIRKPRFVTITATDRAGNRSTTERRRRP